jgi:hypothetical protein
MPLMLILPALRGSSIACRRPGPNVGESTTSHSRLCGPLLARSPEIRDAEHVVTGFIANCAELFIVRWRGRFLERAPMQFHDRAKNAIIAWNLSCR